VIENLILRLCLCDFKLDREDVLSLAKFQNKPDTLVVAAGCAHLRGISLWLEIKHLDFHKDNFRSEYHMNHQEFVKAYIRDTKLSMFISK